MIDVSIERVGNPPERSVFGKEPGSLEDLADWPEAVRKWCGECRRRQQNPVFDFAE